MIIINELKLSFLISGGYDGCQAEWVRVPFADVNLLKIENNRLTDEQVLFLSDIICTG
jgi:threonine dehydrogenase-like Zn-dependent dehydrogenase